jgi:hypothetical protein
MERVLSFLNTKRWIKPRNEETARKNYHGHVKKGKAIPLQALGRLLGFQEVEAPRISRQSALEGGMVVSPTHRPSLPPGRIPGTHFC